MTERVELLELKMKGVELTFVRQRHVIGLELALAGGLGLGEDNRTEALPRGGVGAVVDAGDAGAKGCEHTHTEKGDPIR